MPPLPEHGLDSRPLENQDIDDESEAGDAEAIDDSKKAPTAGGSDDDITEIEPPAPLVQKRNRGDGASESGSSQAPKESTPVESAPKRSRAESVSTTTKTSAPSYAGPLIGSGRFRKKPAPKVVLATAWYVISCLLCLFLEVEVL